jgi:serine/threonine-protein kinase RsbW
MVIASDLRAAREVAQDVLAEIARLRYSQECVFAIRLALEEGLNNAIRHGNGYDPDKTVEVTYDVNEHRAVIAITDQGPGFDPHNVPDPRADENLGKPTGRGIMLIRAYMDEVGYNPRGNQIRMVKLNR